MIEISQSMLMMLLESRFFPSLISDNGMLVADIGVDAERS